MRHCITICALLVSSVAVGSSSSSSAVGLVHDHASAWLRYSPPVNRSKYAMGLLGRFWAPWSAPFFTLSSTRPRGLDLLCRRRRRLDGLAGESAGQRRVRNLETLRLIEIHREIGHKRLVNERPPRANILVASMPPHPDHRDVGGPAADVDEDGSQLVKTRLTRSHGPARTARQPWPRAGNPAGLGRRCGLRTNDGPRGLHLLCLPALVQRQAVARARALRQLIALEPTQEQRSAVEAPFDACFAILGGPAKGKSTALAERMARAKALFPEAEFLVIDDAHRPSHYAAALLAEIGREIRIVDDAEAEIALRALLRAALRTRLAGVRAGSIDPEVPGLRSPDRFAHSAFRLIRRLIDAGIAPAALLSLALRGATEFYASPPNFADPSLLLATKNAFHDSLDVDHKELTRQHRREMDLAKILTKLYEAYVTLADSSGLHDRPRCGRGGHAPLA